MRALSKTTKSVFKQRYFYGILRPPSIPGQFLGPGYLTYANAELRSTKSVACRAKSFGIRLLSVSSATANSSSGSAPTPELPPGSFSDPTRLDLFYHFLEPPTPLSSSAPAYALSFLPSPPPSAESSSIIGFLPAGTSDADQEAGLNDFKENPKFRALLHEAIQSGLKADVDEVPRNGATQLQEGWMHIHDERNVPALGRIGDPDDILASVLVQDGKIVPDSYQPMPAYRLCTSDGITKLTEGLVGHLKKILEQRLETEMKNS
ncbi:hypothetical protein D9757_000811 [Collybiopsis confluens]|uniref:Uncharacterized protein n=1 Tax=Collybiopsis confluens TaxID=2823264 RepID=A0A8H5I050_9AGAR|nr:hypothetical protein D9757_000811 [Collybiopsis confluens]